MLQEAGKCVVAAVAIFTVVVLLKMALVHRQCAVQ